MAKYDNNLRLKTQKLERIGQFFLLKTKIYICMRACTLALNQWQSLKQSATNPKSDSVSILTDSSNKISGLLILKYFLFQSKSCNECMDN